MDPGHVEQFKQRGENQKRIIIEACTKALNGELSLIEAVSAIEQSGPKSQVSFFFVYPEIELLSDFSQEIEWFPEKREAIEAVYRERRKFCCCGYWKNFRDSNTQSRLQLIREWAE